MLSIQELCDRYSISRDRIYVRKRGLVNSGIDLDFVTKDRKSYASLELVEIFDQQNQWIQSGNPMQNFRLVSTPNVVVVEQDNTPIQDKTIHLDNTVEQPYLVPSVDQITDIAIAIAAIAKPLIPKDDFAYIDRLKSLAEDKILITTKEVKQLVGATPNGDRYIRGSFAFVRSGKIGNQYAWLIERI